jgi:hypothetical protein
VRPLQGNSTARYAISRSPNGCDCRCAGAPRGKHASNPRKDARFVGNKCGDDMSLVRRHRKSAVGSHTSASEGGKPAGPGSSAAICASTLFRCVVERNLRALTCNLTMVHGERALLANKVKRGLTPPPSPSCSVSPPRNMRRGASRNLPSMLSRRALLCAHSSQHLPRTAERLST